MPANEALGMSDDPKLGIAIYFPLLLSYIMPDNFLTRLLLVGSTLL